MKLRIAILTLSLLAVSGACGARADRCEAGATNMAEVRDCVARENDAAVSKAYQRLQAKLKRSNPEALRLLAKAQADWLIFAESSCEYYTRTRTEGQMANDFRSQCWSDFSAARVKWLRASELELVKAAGNH